MAQTVKSLPVMRETWVQSLSREDPLEERMVTHSSILPDSGTEPRSPALQADSLLSEPPDSQGWHVHLVQTPRILQSPLFSTLDSDCTYASSPMIVDCQRVKMKKP